MNCTPRAVKPPIVSRICNAEQHGSSVPNNYGRFRSHSEENVCTSAEFSCVYLPSSVRFQIHTCCWSASPQQVS